LTTAEPVTCALLASLRNDWAASLVIATPGLRVVTLAAGALGLEQSPNPFALPTVAGAEAVLVTGYWLQWLRRAHPERAERVLDGLQDRARAVIGMDGADHFELGISPRDLARFPLTLKFQGIFRDRDLYNYDLGPWYDGAVWAEKRRPKAERYRDADLEGLRLAAPCTMLDVPGVRRAARRLEAGAARTVAAGLGPGSRAGRAVADKAFAGALRGVPVAHRRDDVHLVATMTHVQRLQASRSLQSFSGARGLNLPPVVFPPGLTGDAAADRERLRDEAADLRRPYVGRARYVATMARHRIVVAPTGYGELGQRHGWALRTGAALVCQDLSHVRMLYPLRDRENAIFCRPDLSDLAERVAELLADEVLRRRVAGEGRRSLRQWERRWRDQLERAIAVPVRAAVGAPPSLQPR
jgi:hypothetical protein